MNVIITGASSGVGYAVARRFASDPANLVIAMARQEEKLKELAGLPGSGRVIALPFDLSLMDFDPLMKRLQELSVTHIDVLIHNAGLLINKPFEQLEPADWEAVYKVNVFSVAGLTRALMPYMGGKAHTHIVNISSIGGVKGTLKFPGLSAYSSSKGALCIVTECLAEEFKGRNISVNCLALGSVQTEMLSKAFPGYAAGMTPGELSGFIFDFAATGWKYFNGKILEVSSTNP